MHYVLSFGFISFTKRTINLHFSAVKHCIDYFFKYGVWILSNLKTEAWKSDNYSCVFRALLSNLLPCNYFFPTSITMHLLSHFQRWHLGSCYCVADNRSVCLCILWPNTQLAGGCSLCASSPCQWNFPQLRKLCSLIPKFVKKC